MKVQKIICLLVCLVMLFVMCSCADKGANTDSNNSSSTHTGQNSNSQNQGSHNSSEEKNGNGDHNSSDASGNNSQGDNSQSQSNNSQGNSSQGNNSQDNNSQGNNSQGNNSQGNNSQGSNTGCSHKNTTVKNKSAATCTKAGYTGDTYCKDCNKKLSSGTQIAATGHKNTELRNYKAATTTAAGYTGDTYCKDCGTKVATGTVIPKAETIYEKRARTMAAASTKVSHQYPDIEQEILRLVNIEREKAGLSKLTWYEDPYCFVKIRTQEILQSFSHTRPNGNTWHSIYTDAKVELHKASENLAYAENYAANKIAELFVSSWMNSAGHRANILDPDVTLLTVAVVKEGNKFGATQHFFD